LVALAAHLGKPALPTCFAANMSAVDLENVSVRFGEKLILDRVTWRIDDGDRWAILGPNGSGKTTLLKVACGYQWPNAGGVVRRRGVELTDLRELRKSIGWVTSSLAAEIPKRERAIDVAVSGKLAEVGLKRLGPDLSLVSDGAPDGVNPYDDLTPEDFDRAAELLAELGCGELINRPFGVLSQGEQQKTLIARARMAQPWLIILDEPCAGLDPGAREDLLRSLEQLARHSPAIGFVLVTHHLEEITPAFDKLLLLSAGRVAHSGPTDGSISPELLESLYGTRPRRIEQAGGRHWPIW
jgi:iron complex transport system ATP-binding protein